MIKGTETEELQLPLKVVASYHTENADALLNEKPSCVSLFGKTSEQPVLLCGNGAYVLLDYGREIGGGIRIITSDAKDGAKLHIRFGESLSETRAALGEKNAGNDHSPRDMVVPVSALSDLTFGQTAFRFVWVEAVGDGELAIQSVMAVRRFTQYPYEGFIETDDEEINRILSTAAYTIHMNCQNGYIWDGVKRDRLVWSGDLHQEIVTAAYLFGDIANIPNSLAFLRDDTKDGEWVNRIPTYSAWWVVNFCSYYGLSGNREFFDGNIAFARDIFRQLNACVAENGEMHFPNAGMEFFLDWPTYETPDAVTGAAALIVFAAKCFLRYEDNDDAEALCEKLNPYLNVETKSKQVRAFQVLAGGDTDGAAAQLEKDGAHGFSTFMSYYILTADAMSGGRDMLPLIKSYFGGMLSRGATTFWEDFDLDWLDGSGSIDEMPENGKKDLHGDYGNYCYRGFRHSLCHGWSAGVYAFFVEYVLGVRLENGVLASVEPHPSGLTHIKAEIPLTEGMLCLEIRDGDIVCQRIQDWSCSSDSFSL